MPAAGAEVVLGRLELDVGGAGHRVEDAHALGDDLRPDAVAGDEREAQRRWAVGHAQWPVSPPLSRRSMDFLDGLLDGLLLLRRTCGSRGGCGSCGLLVRSSRGRASAGLRDGEPALLAGPAAAAKYEDLPLMLAR